MVKDMPLDQVMMDELKANIGVARKRELTFGLCIGKSPETTILLCHKTKDAETMGRMAKKDGETAKVAFGTMTVDGKNLNLSCQGDVPTGIARKTREMLKLANLKLKVRVLDPNGNPIEEDGDDEEEGAAPGGAAADPLAEEWAATRERMAPQVEAAKALPDGAALHAAWQEALGFADGGDLRGGLNALEALARRITEAETAASQSEADKARWEASRTKLEPMVQDIVDEGGAGAAKIKAVWEFILGKVAAEVPDYATAIKAITSLVKLIQEARASAPTLTADAMGNGDGGGPGGATTTAPSQTTASTGSTPPQPTGPTPTQGPVAQPTQTDAAPTADPLKPPAPNASDKEKFDFAEAKLKGIDTAIPGYMALIPGSTEPVPAAWTAARGKIDAVLAPMRGPGAKIDAKKVADAVKGIDLLAGVIAGKATEKRNWKQTLDLVRLRLVPLDSHQQKAAPQVAPKITAIKAEIDKAVVKANAQDFKGATALIAPLSGKCDAAEKLADDLAHYRSIETQRNTIVTSLGADTGFKEVDGLKKALVKLHDDAQKLATKEKFGEAVAKLNQMPAIHDQFRRIKVLATNYQNWEDAITARFQAIDAQPADVRAPFQKQIAKWKVDFGNAKYAKTKDYAKSMPVLREIYALVKVDVASGTTPADPDKDGWLVKELNARTAYNAALKAMEDQLKIFKPHKGRSGIEEFYLGMERDLAQGKAEGDSGKYSTGAAILARSATQWPGQKTLADQCEAYITKRDEVAKVIAGLKGKAGEENGISQAEALMASAVKQFVAKDFVAAKATVEQAEARAGEAKAASDAQADLGKLKDNGALAGVAADLDKAIEVYDKMRANVAGKVGTGPLAAELARADAEAKKARDEKGKPAPDAVAARNGLDAGIAILEATLPKAMAQGPYASHLSEAKSLTAGLVALNLDDCIKVQMDRANQAIKDAEALAKAPGFDFAAAEAKLVTAREGARKAQADAGLWPTIKADRLKIKTAKDNIDAVPAAAALMTATLTRLTTAMNDIDTKKTAEDFKAAKKIAADGALAATRTAKDLTTVKAILLKYKSDYTDKTGPGAGKVPGPNGAKAKSEVDLLAAKHAQYQAALTAGNYESALFLITEMGWAIDASIRILGEYDAYEIARAAAELKVNALRAVRNAGVEAEVKAIEKRYDDAVALSAGEKHKPAEKALLPLPADCDKLITKANDWKGYDDALTAAQAKINLMDSHAQAVVMRPMTNALRGKMTAAISTASKGDLKGAKALLDPIPGEADAALQTAKGAGDVIDKAGDVGKTPIDPAVLAEAEKVYDKVAADPNAALVKADLDLARSRLDLAKSPVTDPTLARASLKASMEACARAQVTLSQTELVKKAVAAVKVELTALKSHVQKAYIAPEIGVIETEIKAVEDDLAKSGPDVVGNRVRVLEERCAAAKILADKHVEYVALRAKPEVEARLPVLEKHDHRYSIKPSIDAFRKKLEEAAKESAAKNPATAIQRLKEARSLGASAFMMAEMRANKPPTKAEVKAIISGPGGDAELDAMLAKLEPDAQRKVIVVAFEARFGVSLESFTLDGTGKPTVATGGTAAGVLDAPNLKRFYDLMIKLPKDHVVDNDSMRKFSSKAAGGSLYSGQTKEVVMAEGDAALSGAYGFGREHEVGGADDNCKPANDKEVTFFSWNTLHEVGHAVDDKLGYMDRNGGSDAYGGWTTYNTDTNSIAKAIAPHFKYDETYIGQYLSKRTAPAIPPVPAGETCSDDEWDARRTAFEAWAKTAFTGNSPWASNSTATRLAIGGIVYQESYGFRWTSYKVGARKQGMTGYQFRAPGEWFAELYAAFHSEKLKPTHPAFGWLKTL